MVSDHQVGKVESRRRKRRTRWTSLGLWVVLFFVLQFLPQSAAVQRAVTDASRASKEQQQQQQQQQGFKSSASTAHASAGKVLISHVRRRTGSSVGGGSASGGLTQSSLLPPTNLSAPKGLSATTKEHTTKQQAAGVNTIDQIQDDVSESDVNKASDRARAGSLSYLYHQRVYGISLGSTILSFSVLGLVAFVVYAKHRSALVYRATEDYEAAYDRMLAVLESYPQYRPIFEHRQLTVFLLDGQVYDSAEKATELVLTADRIHQICDQCESRRNTE